MEDGPELREDQGQVEGWKITDILDSIRSQRHILNETAKYLETDLIVSQKTIERQILNWRVEPRKTYRRIWLNVFEDQRQIRILIGCHVDVI